MLELWKGDCSQVSGVSGRSRGRKGRRAGSTRSRLREILLQAHVRRAYRPHRRGRSIQHRQAAMRSVRALTDCSLASSPIGACRLVWPILRGWGARDPGSNPGWPTMKVLAYAIHSNLSIRMFKAPSSSQ